MAVTDASSGLAWVQLRFLAATGSVHDKTCLAACQTHPSYVRGHVWRSSRNTSPTFRCQELHHKRGRWMRVGTKYKLSRAGWGLSELWDAAMGIRRLTSIGKHGSARGLLRRCSFSHASPHAKALRFGAQYKRVGPSKRSLAAFWLSGVDRRKWALGADLNSASPRHPHAAAITNQQMTTISQLVAGFVHRFKNRLPVTVVVRRGVSPKWCLARCLLLRLGRCEA